MLYLSLPSVDTCQGPHDLYTNRQALADGLFCNLGRLRLLLRRREHDHVVHSPFLSDAVRYFTHSVRIIHTVDAFPSYEYELSRSRRYAKVATPFHVVILPMPPGRGPFDSVEAHGQLHGDIRIDTTAGARFPCTFEEVATRFAELPRMFLEADGAFVWVIERNGVRHQLDGTLTDDGTFLVGVELKGTCDGEALDLLLTALSWPEQQLLFQSVVDGFFLTEAGFRRFASIR